MKDVLRRNELILLALANYLKKGVLSNFINEVMEGLITEKPIVFLKEEIGTLKIKRKDALPLRCNVGSFNELASRIPDNISGDFHQESIMKISYPFKASFVIINPEQITKKRTIILKIIKESE